MTGSHHNTLVAWFGRVAAETRRNQFENRAREIEAGIEAGTHCQGCDGPVAHGFCVDCEEAV